MLKRFQLLALLLLLSPNVKAQGKWVFGNYASWQTGVYPTNRIDMTAVTHINLDHWLTNSDGTIQSSSWDSSCADVVTPAHAAGVKVTMMLGGSDDSNFASAAENNMSTLVSSIQSKISGCSLDGVEIDWEQSVNTAVYVQLAQTIKAANSSLIVACPVDPTIYPASFPAAASQYCDRINMETFGWQSYSGLSWYFAALDGYSSNHPFGIKTFVSNWEAAGVPAAKINIGIGFFAVGYTGVTGPNQSGENVVFGELGYGTPLTNGGGVLSCYYNVSNGTYYYDPSPALSSTPSNPPQQPSISSSTGITASTCSGTAINWVTYEDEASIAAKGAYVQSAGLGGVDIWTLGEGATDPTIGRDPLLDAVKLSVLQSGPAPDPLLATTGVVGVGGATTLSITGLPSNLTQVVIGWTNWTSGVAWDDSSDTGYITYGQPSAYTIQASTNGSSWTTLLSISSEHYNGRQWMFDFTGTGYTQVRMNISSIVGSNAGTDEFFIHNAPNNATDTWFLFGDSITANCWKAANNTPPEQFGTQINAARPNRFPVNTEGGQSGWLSSDALTTTVYGVPNIVQFLNDLEDVKYVGISLGTNDANEGVSASTYCANMQQIVQYVIQAGRVPIIPTIVASPAANVQANAPAMNGCLATLKQNYPSIISGPDLWTLFSGHSTSDGWFVDSLHPSPSTGCTALQNAWTNAMLSTIYPQQQTTPPNPPTNLQVKSVL